MLKSICNSTPIPKDVNMGDRKRVYRPSGIHKRAQSASPVAQRKLSPTYVKRPSTDRRCQSLSPLRQMENTCPNTDFSQHQTQENQNTKIFENFDYQVPEKELTIPQCLVTKTMRVLATKKREFLKLRNNLLSHQNTLLEHYAALRELESRVGKTDETMGEVRILSVKNWPAHDLLLLVRDDLQMPMNSDISGIFGPQVLQQLQAQLNPIPEEVLGVGAELMARRLELLNLLRCKHRPDRSTYVTNLEWKSKNIELDNETEQLHRLVAGTAENLKAKIIYSLDLAKIPWRDRELMVKKIEHLQKEILILQHKIDGFSKKEHEDKGPVHADKATCEELEKERAAREALKEVVSSAEGMLRVARARIATLERQLKDSRNELENAKRKHKDLEQLYRHRETCYDARSKKLLEVSKTGEMTIEALSRQRDALETRVKELREQAEAAEQAAETRCMEERARAEMLNAKVAEQERNRQSAELRAVEMEGHVKELEEQLNTLRERSVRLVDMDRRRYLEYIPSKENEPSDREVDIWKELQITKVALGRAEEELRQSRADKDSFLESLSKIVQEEGNNKQDKLATELLHREQKVMRLQQIIEEQRENERIMEQSMTEYENQLASLRLEVKRLRNYDCYSKEVSYQDMQNELLELHIQVETLSRERSALVTAAASRALMLERHERSADIFARMIRARRELIAFLDNKHEPQLNNESANRELPRSLSTVCTGAADTWTALRAERARVLRLESAVLAQSMQLEREGRVRTQLERRRAVLEREILRSRHPPTSQCSIPNLSLVSQ